VVRLDAYRNSDDHNIYYIWVSVFYFVGAQSFWISKRNPFLQEQNTCIYIE